MKWMFDYVITPITFKVVVTKWIIMRPLKVYFIKVKLAKQFLSQSLLKKKFFLAIYINIITLGLYRYKIECDVAVSF